MKRIVCLWLPSFRADRLTRVTTAAGCAPFQPWAELPFAVAAEVHGGQRVAAVNQAAEAAGLSVGLPLADARALCPSLKTVPEDPKADLAALTRLTDWCRRYTPWTALDGLDDGGGAGLSLDITGCAHLFGGEEKMLAEIHSRLSDFGLTVRLGCGDTIGAAWAAARFMTGTDTIAVVPEGAARQWFANLPVAALRLPAKTLETLKRLGLKRISELQAVPRGPLARRFGRELLMRLDQLVGDAAEPLSPRKEAIPLFARIAFPEPIGKTEDVEAALTQLLEALSERMAKDELGARRVSLDIFRVDGAAAHLHAGTARPVRQAEHLFRLFRDKLDGLDAGFGIEAMTLRITETEPLKAAQIEIKEAAGAKQADDMALLVDRLSGRLGPKAVLRPVLKDAHLPEAAISAVPALEATGSELEPPPSLIRPGMRPLTLLSRPALLDIELGQAPRLLPFSAFTWQRSRHVVRAADGPERISGSWWDKDDGSLTRDYFRVEAETGLRAWVFNHLGPRSSEWYLHGVFS